MMSLGMYDLTIYNWYKLGFLYNSISIYIIYMYVCVYLIWEESCSLTTKFEIVPYMMYMDFAPK